MVVEHLLSSKGHEVVRIPRENAPTAKLDVYR